MQNSIAIATKQLLNAAVVLTCVRILRMRLYGLFAYLVHRIAMSVKLYQPMYPSFSRRPGDGI